MRIIAGDFRGRRLALLGKGDSGAHLRPTSDRVRESLFSMLTHLDVIRGARVLDLFAGTGALGLEALSRGAAHVCFVDDARVATRLIRQNIDLTDSAGRTTLVKQDATSLAACSGAAFDLVFLDPPYGQGLGDKALAVLVAGGWVVPGATVVWEENAPMPAPVGFEPLSTRKFGDTHITLLRI